MSRWLVAGAGGMLGSDMTAALRAAGHAVDGLTRRELDITDAAACREAVLSRAVVANCAAWTDVDGAEAHEALAFDVNAVGAHNLALACAAAGATLVHFSTDYVFAGAAHAPYRPDGPIAPLNAYGRTKAAGEWAVRVACPASYIVRTAWLYGRNGPNFVDTMVRRARERETVDVVADQMGQPTLTSDLAGAVVALVDEGAPFGVHHGTAAGATTWHGLAQEIFATLGLEPERVRPTTSSAFPRPAPRPTYSVMAHDLIKLPEWQDALHRFLKELEGQP